MRQLIFNQVFAQQSILAEIIIYWKWLINANPGVKDFPQTRDWTPVDLGYIWLYATLLQNPKIYIEITDWSFDSFYFECIIFSLQRKALHDYSK